VSTVKQHFEPEAGQFRSGTVGPQYYRADGTNFPVTGFYFDASTEETVYFRSRAFNFGASNTSITVLISWYADTASSGDVIWGVSFAAITPNTDTQDIETKAFATEVTVTDSHLGTVGQRAHDISVANSNIDSAGPDDILIMRVARKASAGGDTMTGDAILTMIDISYSDV
jgi:hypothetical protein